MGGVTDYFIDYEVDMIDAEHRSQLRFSQNARREPKQSGFYRCRVERTSAGYSYPRRSLQDSFRMFVTLASNVKIRGLG